MEDWIRKVKTVSTFPPPGIFKQHGDTIARVMASPEVSPKGLGSAIKMIQYHINRSGKNLKDIHRRELQRAIKILQKRMCES